ncbi:MAG: lytic transglycosylase domain-containing protein, partial [Desulfovibrio fairfieldensis]|nr:lytic transglycosylase domain-containing protein [Desulfovibrio fairfieldensis]
AAVLVLGKSPELGLNEKNFLPLQAAGAAPLEKNIKTGRPEKRRLAMQGSYDAPAWTPQGLPRISRLP